MTSSAYNFIPIAIGISDYADRCHLVGSACRLGVNTSSNYEMTVVLGECLKHASYHFEYVLYSQ